MYREEMKMFFKSHGLTRSCHLPVNLEDLTRMSDPMCDLEHLNSLTELRSYLGLWNVFRCSEPKLGCVAALLNKMLRKSRLQAFDRLAVDEITALVTLKLEINGIPWIGLFTFVRWV